MSAEERLKRAQELSRTRILTPADFERIKQLRLERKLVPAVRARKRGVADGDADGESKPADHGIVEADDLLPDRKKRRQTKEERLADVMKGREGRGEFNKPKGRMNEFASTSNREKARLKNPMMLRLSAAVQAKRNRKLSEKLWAKHGSKKKGQQGRKRR